MTRGNEVPQQNERRYNFALNSLGAADIVLPGVHSDLGGGYLPKAIERVFLSKPRRREVDEQVPFTEANSYKLAQNDLRRLQRQLAHYDLALEVRAWEMPFTFTEDRKRRDMKNVYAAVSSQREVHGDLSFITSAPCRTSGLVTAWLAVVACSDPLLASRTAADDQTSRPRRYPRANAAAA